MLLCRYQGRWIGPKLCGRRYQDLSFQWRGVPWLDGWNVGKPLSESYQDARPAKPVPPRTETQVDLEITRK